MREPTELFGPPLDAVAAHHLAMALPIADVVAMLVDMLGLTAVAVIGGVKETRAVTQWLSGREPQQPHVLRFALQLARMVAGTHQAEMAKAWFYGTNPSLGDRSPMIVLREHSIETVHGPLLDAARAFAARAGAGTPHAGEHHKTHDGHT